MFTSWKLGRVAGIDLFLHPSALLWLFIVGGPAGDIVAVLPALVVLFGSILLHELGHALMARRYGIGTRDITLSMIGGVARLQRMPRSAGPELLIALAGPAVNAVIATAAVAAIGLAASLRLPAGFLVQVASLNLGLLLFNLLPVFPMDGGRVLRALLSGWLGRARATEVAATVGQLLAVGGGVLGIAAGQWALAILAVYIYAMAAVERNQVLGESRRTDPRRQGLINPPAAPAGFRWADRGDGVWRLVPNLNRSWTWGQP